MHEGEGSWAAYTRLAELSDLDVDHTWLELEECADSVRLRWGCAGPLDPCMACAGCQCGLLDSSAAHATCCALGEATRGHIEATALIHAAAQSCDHTAEVEVPGLIPGTDLRPADVLASALGNANTALNISSCSPSQEADTDCTRSRLLAKLNHHGPRLPSLLRQNISYTPIVWGACGRPHQDTLAVLRSAQTQLRFGGRRKEHELWDVPTAVLGRRFV